MVETSRLSTDDLKVCCTGEQFSFDSTEELDELDEVIGQDRAVEAVEFGVSIQSPGYNMFALGEKGIGKKQTTEEFLQRKASEQTVPSDWIYVNNFERPDQPHAIELPSGEGKAFRDDMDDFVDQLRTDVPQAFDREEYQQEQQKIQKAYEQKRKKLLQQLDQKAQEYDFTVVNTPGGPMLAPMVNGEVMTPDEFGELDDEEREKIEDRREELEEEQQEIRDEILEEQNKAREEIRELDKRVIKMAVEGLIETLRDRYEDQEKIQSYLDAVMENLLDNVDMFKQLKQMEQGGQSQMAMLMQQGQEQPNFDRYRVNLLVDNSELDGAPVVYESNPTYYNLLGRIEHEGGMNELRTDFTMIKEGALHQANGGYLILEAKDILTQPFAWEGLKRALKNRQIHTEPMGLEYRTIQTRTLDPEAIPLNVNVVLLGNSMLYHLLYTYDEDFQELFKVKADFANLMDRDEEVMKQYAKFIGNLCEEEDLSHFDPTGVAQILEEAIRDVGDQEKLTARTNHVADLVREASFWAGKDGSEQVSRKHVQEAVDHQIYRSNRVDERIRELIEEGTILIDIDESVVGQVNGLSVMQLGDYSFGKPSRITARVYAGREGVVNIDREVDLGGQIHNKGVMILSGYLGGEFAGDRPLALSASLTFEQTYQEVDGDSASSTELYAILSALAEVSLRQDIAVTGSVNQRGEVQAIGGVNEKIEGFYKVCKENGLTGEQGVLIPKSNVKNLMLRDEVVEAVEEDHFHVYPVSHVDEGIEILTGKPAGERQDDGTFPEDSIKGMVEARLKELAEIAESSSDSPTETSEEV